MLLQNASLASPSLASTPMAQNKSWQVGQILQVVVQGRDQSGLLEVKIGNDTFTAMTSKVYPAGQMLNLQVVDNRETLVLQNREPTKTDTRETRVEQLLRHSLPKQGKLLALVKILSDLAPNFKVAGQDSAGLPRSLVNHLLDTHNVLPLREQVLDPQTLKQSIKDSGLFMEAKLATTLQGANDVDNAQTSSVLKSDLKAKLLILMHAIEQSLQLKKDDIIISTKSPIQTNTKLFGQNSPQNSEQNTVHKTIESRAIELLELRQTVESAIARIQVNQSQAIVTEEQSIPVWIIDLPIIDEQHGNMAELKIRYEDAQTQTDDPLKKWTVDLTLDIATLGKIHVHLNLLGEELSSSIWAEHTLTNHLIEQNLRYLEERLLNSGLKVVALNQLPRNQENPIRTRHHSSLLSTKI